MAEVVVTAVLENISGLLFEEGKFLLHVRVQVEELRGELEALQSFLIDANARKHEDERLRTCVRQAKRLAYRAEDIIEEYAIKVASKRGWGFGKVARRVACILREGNATHQVGNEIGNIKTEIVNLTKRLEAYGVNRIIEARPSSASIEKQRRLRTTYAHEVEEYFVGMEDDVSKIVAWVAEDSKIRRVISICGVGGLGKTTIARKVFNHFKKSSKRTFECFAWVSVTQQFQVKMLLQDILTQVMEHKGNDLGEEVLVRKLYDVLKNKKCLVVLDDMWKLEDWESLRPAIPISEGNSNIIITTRIREVAEIAHRDSRHEPTLLDEKDGWDLLTKMALNVQEGQGNTLPNAVEVEGRAMLSKCGGLPLAIVALGGILRNKDPLIEWKTVNKKFETYLRGNTGVLSVLAFSYDDLPSYLRPCFLYMGCFKEDEKIDVTRLYQLWMAEGLISSSRKDEEETMMDVASVYLHELISRNMVQPQVRDELTDEKSCRLHDLMRELCLTKGKEEEFMEVKSIQIREVNSVCIDGLNLCRQTILIDGGELDCTFRVEQSTYETCIRALIFNRIFNHDIIISLEGRVKFRRLRSIILDGINIKDQKLPNEMRDMIHLRYLSLRDSLNSDITDISLSYGKLPSFIGDLQYLQTLDISENFGLQLPNIFHKMKRLRCLYLPDKSLLSKYRKRLEFHGLNELEVLEGFDTEYCQSTFLSEFVNMQRFEATIWGYKDLSNILDQLSCLRKLQYISIRFRARDSFQSQMAKSFPVLRKLLLCQHLKCLVIMYSIGDFPRYEPEFCANLVSLSLKDTKFEEDPMPFLQELPNLRELRVNEDAYVGKEMYCSSKAFPKLTSLSLIACPIEIWRVDDGAFPNLSSLSIRECRSFKEIVPHGLTRITSLTQIYIYDMPEQFRNKYGRLHKTDDISMDDGT